MMKNLSVVIVGSHAGRHLKMPVPLLPFGDSTILNRTLSAYLDAGVSEIVLTLGYRGAEIQAALGPLASHVQSVIATNPDEELAWLIRQGIEKINPTAKAFAIGMGDQPLLTHELVDHLASRFSASKSRIFVPVCQGILGYPVFFEASMAAEFKKLSPRGGPWDVIKTHGSDVHDHQLYDTAVIRHVDDTEEYHEALRLAGLPIPEGSAFALEGGDSGLPLAESDKAGSRGPIRIEPDHQL